MANKEYKFSNETEHLYPQCKVVLYPWKEILNNPELSDEKLSQSGRLDISSQIQSVTFSKNMGSPAGSFSIDLTNSPNYGTNDWKDIIKRGYWLVIYMSQDGDLRMNPSVGPNLAKNKMSEAKRIRCIGYVDRVSVKMSVEENRSINVGFTVTGRDFGAVYDDTNIWHNMFQFDKIILDSISQTKLNITGNVRIHEAIKLIHDLFYYPLNIPGAKVNDNKSLLSIGLQWLMPKEMISDIGFNLSKLPKGTFWGTLPGVFEPEVTGAGIAIEKPGDYLTGNAWQQLKRLSIPQYHELFCETTDEGKPKLTFRPIPWGIDQSKYPINAPNIKMYKDLSPVVTVPAVQLYDVDLGEDDNSRYNSFLATVSTGLINTEDNTSLLLGRGFPKNNTASIKRHGFRPMHITVDSIVKNEELANGSADLNQLVEFNEVLYDYWNNAVYAESGSINKRGSNDVKIGKVMKFRNDVPYLSTKRYYIEGYVDTFMVGDKRERSWTQTVILTRGFEEADLKSKVGFSVRNTEFKGSGEYTKGSGENN
jgi:hypothetical protein